MKQLLVLGSEGFIGSQVVLSAIQEGYYVYGVDLADRKPVSYRYKKISLFSSDIDDFFASNIFDLIINCAGSGNVSFSFQDTVTDFDLNTRSLFFILEAIRKYQPVVKYVHLSSAAVYGNPGKLPIAETDPIEPISPYGYHKWMSEVVCREYAHLFGLDIAIARPFSVYGPNLQKQLIWDIFQKANQDNQITLWGTGEETRDFIFVEDVALALLKIGTFEKSGLQTYNLASGESVTIKHLTNLLIDSMGLGRDILFNGQVRQGDPRFWQADITELKAIGFKPSVSLKDGIKQTITWLVAKNTKK